MFHGKHQLLVSARLLAGGGLHPRGGGGGAFGGFGGEARGGDELGVSGVVAGGVVVLPAGCDDLNGGQGGGLAMTFDDADRDLSSGDVAFDERGVPVGEAADHGCGKLGGLVDSGGAEGRAAAGGLDVEGQPEALHYLIQDRCGSEVMDNLFGQRNRAGGPEPSAADDGLGGRLVASDAAGVSAATD